MESFWAVIPAAGVGRRMGAERPKQYLEVAGKTILEHTISIFLENDKITGVVVSLSKDDPFWPTLSFSSQKPIMRADGGAQRSDSVLNALALLRQQAAPKDWVLVHDAARPCLSQDDLNKLISEGVESASGALLASPCRDTMKMSGSNRCVENTIDRATLWHALTPQMFPLETLVSALESTKHDGIEVTDDCMAMERMGFQPLLVEGSAENIKVTRPEDLGIAETVIERRESNS